MCVKTGDYTVSGYDFSRAGEAFARVGFSRCRPKNQGLKASDRKLLRSARLKACPRVSTFGTAKVAALYQGMALAMPPLRSKGIGL